jgi:hypothetical protein
VFVGVLLAFYCWHLHNPLRRHGFYWKEEGAASPSLNFITLYAKGANKEYQGPVFRGDELEVEFFYIDNDSTPEIVITSDVHDKDFCIVKFYKNFEQDGRPPFSILAVNGLTICSQGASGIREYDP